jgi:uncharacterized protein YjbI with pentapeptide repeats
LPRMEISPEELLRACNDQSAQSRNTWFTFLLLGTYLAVTVGSTSHKQLLLESPVALPLLGVTLPMVAFFKIAPWLFVLMHFFMLVQLYLLSRTLHAFNAALPQPALRTQLDSFPLTQLIAGVPTDWAANLFVKLSCWITLLFAPIVLLLEFQVQFLPYHDVGAAYIHRMAIVVDLLICWLLWPAIMRPSGGLKSAWQQVVSWSDNILSRLPRQIRREEPSPEPGQSPGPAASGSPATAAGRLRAVSNMAATILILVLSLTTIGFSFLLATIPGEALETWVARRVPDVESIAVRKQCGLSPNQPERDQPLRPLACLGSLSVWFGARSTENDAHLAANGLPARWRVWWPTVVLFEGPTASEEIRRSQAGYTNDEDARLGLRFEKADHLNIANKSQQPGNLFARNLTAVFSQQAPGQKSSGDDQPIALGHRDLRFARLRDANLQGAELSGADLTGADLAGANLQNANMINLIATSARFDHALLKGAKLDLAWLQGARLWRAELEDASLRYAHLQGADLATASAERADFSNADLRATFLVAATLTGAKLSGADLSGSDVSSGTLDGVELSCAKLKAADLSDASLAGAGLDCEANADVMRSVNLHGVTFDPSVNEDAKSSEAGGKRPRARRSSTKQSDIADAKKSWDPFLKAQNPKVGPDPAELAKQLTEIACHGDAFTAAGIVRRIRNDGGEDNVPKLVAKAMMNGDCKGAALMSRANRDDLPCVLQGVIFWRCSKAVQLVRDRGDDPASADLKQALKNSP